MILEGAGLENGAVLQSDVVVVGAGPAGITTALELARTGYRVLLAESGLVQFDETIQRLSDASEWDVERHAPMALAARRQVGGASTIWGGRCVPYDPIDFNCRPYVPDGHWPISYEELVPYFQRACSWLVCGRPVFDAEQIATLPRSIVPGLPNGQVRSSSLERWSLPTDFGREYAAELQHTPHLQLVTGLTCTNVVCGAEDGRVSHLESRTIANKQATIRGKFYVLAAGGLDTTRLLLASHMPTGRSIGDHSGHLGRWYMGHAEGVIANVRFSTPPRETIFDYERDIDGTYVRRRFSFSSDLQREQELPNIAAWLANPELPDPAHRSGALSGAYLALASPLGRRFAPDAQRLSLTGTAVPGAPYSGTERGPLAEHLKNMVRDWRSTFQFTFGFGSRRFLARGRKIPGYFAYNPDNVYPLQYHGEHLPHLDSRVTLTDDMDMLGMPRLKIDIRFSSKDVEGVLRAHRCWDSYLRSHGRGQLEYLGDDPESMVWERLGGGFHQIGTTRMAESASDGVVNPQLAVHGTENLFVASSSVFPTSGQANSTFMIVAFSVRLADHLRHLLVHT